MSVILGMVGLILAGSAGGLLLGTHRVDDEDELPKPPDEGEERAAPPLFFRDDVVLPLPEDADVAPPASAVPVVGAEITSGDDPPDPVRDVVLHGGEGPDGLEGGAGQDQLFGGGGDDQLVGQGGDDRLLGGAGRDSLAGGMGDDSLRGGAGDDALSGGMGEDGLFGGGGDDTLFGGAGDDRLYGGTGHDWLQGGAGDDRLEIGAGGGTLDGGDGHDHLIGHHGAPSFLNGQEGDDRLSLTAGDIATGGLGADQFEISARPEGEAVTVLDYTAGEDRLLLLYDSTEPVPEVELSQGQLPDEVVVHVNGVEIARVIASGGLQPSEIALVPRV